MNFKNEMSLPTFHEFQNKIDTSPDFHEFQNKIDTFPTFMNFKTEYILSDM